MNGPRFYVRESGGIPIGQYVGRWTVEYLVLDSAYCHRVVATHGTNIAHRSGPLRGSVTRATALRQAEREAERLNTWAASA